MKEKLVDAITNMREDEALKLTQEMLDAGEAPQTILDAGREALALVGERYDAEEYFLPELILSGETIKEIAELVKPHLQEDATETNALGKVVIGTVAGDIHDVGKDIVAFMLDVNNFEIYDLGVDVPAETFVEKIKEVQPQIVAISGFLTLAFDAMKATVEAIKEAGVRESVKIMIGGAPMDDTVTSYIGADAYRPDASAAVTLAKEWIGGI
ncbi:MAG: methionine synthase [bacterium]|nr:methionine synthase [bacterium]